MLTCKEHSPSCALNPAAGLRTWPSLASSRPLLPCHFLRPMCLKDCAPACGTGTVSPLCSALWHRAANPKRQPHRTEFTPQEVINNYWLNKVMNELPQQKSINELIRTSSESQNLQ